MGEGSFRDHLRALIPRLRRFGHALTGSWDDGDDLLHDALEKALLRQEQFVPGTRLDSWVYRIMQTTWIDKKRAEGRRLRIVEPLTDTLSVKGEDGRTAFDARVDLAHVRDMMARLHHDEKAVLALVAIEGLSYREAAEVLDIPIGTVMSRLARARANLVALLEAPPKAVRGGIQ